MSKTRKQQIAELDKEFINNTSYAVSELGQYLLLTVDYKHIKKWLTNALTIAERRGREEAVRKMEDWMSKQGGFHFASPFGLFLKSLIKQPK